jgi:transposase
MTTKQVTIGLDLGDRQHAACVLAANGQVLAEATVVNTRECLCAFAQRWPRAVIAMETGTHSPWISRLLQAQGHRVVVANARKLRAISQSTRKSDEADARLLARLCRADESLLSPVTHRSEACQRALVRLKTRDALVRSRVDLSNSARFLVKSLGLRLPTGIKATAFTRKTRELLDEATCALIEPLLQGIDALNAQIKTLERALAQLAEETYPDTALLQQIAARSPDRVPRRQLLRTAKQRETKPQASQAWARSPPCASCSRSRRRSASPGPATWAPIWAWSRVATSPGKPTNSSASPRRATPSCAACWSSERQRRDKTGRVANRTTARTTSSAASGPTATCVPPGCASPPAVARPPRNAPSSPSRASSRSC